MPARKTAAPAAKKAVPAKKAAVKRAVASVSLADPAGTVQPPSSGVVDAKAVAAIYEKARKSNNWCADGRQPFEKELLDLGVPITVSPSQQFVELSLRIKGSQGALDNGYFVSEPFAREVAVLLNQWLAEVTQGKVIAVKVPRGSRLVTVEVTPKVEAITQRVFNEARGVQVR